MLVSWISVVNLGFVLGSCFLLTDAIAFLFFLAFCYFFYQSFYFIGEQKSKITNHFWYTASAALCLSGYTWLRPNGQFLTIAGLIILVFAQGQWKEKLKRMALFVGLFLASIAPWYIRNYQLTEHWFFCPMSGPYLHAFCAPRILEKVTGKDLGECQQYLGRLAYHAMQEEQNRIQKETPHLYMSRELVCSKIAWPICMRYPWYWMLDWMREVCITTFDLYSSQLVKFVDRTYKFDPPREFLSIKLAAALYKQPMSLPMRLICWLELLFSIMLWIGLFGGMVKFLIMPLAYGFDTAYVQRMTFLWLKVGMLIGVVVIMAGGYGYARLRMPIDVLMMILSLTFWYWLLYEKNKKKNKGS